MVNKYVLVRMKRDTYGKFKIRNANLTNAIKKVTGRNKRIPMTKFYDFLANQETIYPDININPITNNTTTEDTWQINMIGKQNISVEHSGDYMFEVSPLFYCTGGAPAYVDLWWQKNGVNVPRSNTRVTIQNNNLEVVATVPFIIDLMPGDNLRIMWNSNKATCSMYYLTNQTAPVRPETPSTILTITKISEVTS